MMLSCLDFIITSDSVRSWLISSFSSVLHQCLLGISWSNQLVWKCPGCGATGARESMSKIGFLQSLRFLYIYERIVYIYNIYTSPHLNCMLTGNRITFSFVTCLYSGSLCPFLTCVSVSVHDANSHKYSGLNGCHSLLLNVFAPISAPWPTFSTSPLNLSGSWKDRTISGEQACDFAHSTKQKMIQF